MLELNEILQATYEFFWKRLKQNRKIIPVIKGVLWPLTGVLVLLWIVFEVFNIEIPLEPFVVLITLLSSLLSYLDTEVDRRNNLLNTLNDIYREKFGNQWVKIEHSELLPNLKPVGKITNIVIEGGKIEIPSKDITILVREKLHNVWSVKNIHRVIGGSSTINFRVGVTSTNQRHLRRFSSVVNPILFRIHRGKTLDEVRLIQNIHKKVFKSDVFKCGDFLKPLTPPFEASFNKKKYICEYYPYLDNVTHFPGTSEALCAVARKLAELHISVLAGLDKSQFIGLGPPPWSKHDSDRLGRVLMKQSKTGNDDEFSLLVKANEQFLCNINVELSDFEPIDSDYPVLHDCHPHDTFFRQDECVLIYDYHRVYPGAEGEALSFTLHRFVREYVMNHTARNPVTPDLVYRGCLLFLREYRKVSGHLPSNLVSNCDRFIKRVTFGKMMNNLEYSIDSIDNYDTYFRTRDEWYSEVSKFISLLKESSFFKDALNLLSNNHPELFS